MNKKILGMLGLLAILLFPGLVNAEVQADTQGPNAVFNCRSWYGQVVAHLPAGHSWNEACVRYQTAYSTGQVLADCQTDIPNNPVLVAACVAGWMSFFGPQYHCPTANPAFPC